MYMHSIDRKLSYQIAYKAQRKSIAAMTYGHLISHFTLLEEVLSHTVDGEVFDSLVQTLYHSIGICLTSTINT
jgi:hypothetical protein